MRIRQCSPESYGSNKSPEVISFLRGVTEMRIYCRVKFEPCFVTPLRATCTKLKIIIFAVSIYLDESNSRLESSANMCLIFHRSSLVKLELETVSFLRDSFLSVSF